MTDEEYLQEIIKIYEDIISGLQKHLVGMSEWNAWYEEKWRESFERVKKMGVKIADLNKKLKDAGIK